MLDPRPDVAEAEKVARVEEVAQAAEVAEETPVSPVERQHILFLDLMKCLKRKLNVFLVGPAGSGKTMAVEMAAAKLGYNFFCQSVSGQTTLSHLFGFIGATGNYVSTGFRDAFEKGGVFLLDEGDAGNANVITAINSALSNGYCSFPDKMVKKHADFIFVAAGNTYGTGATRQYVGRNALDAATLDRFVFFEWPYDEVLETNLTPKQHIDWVDLVQCYRKAASELDIRIIISPRCTFNGYNLIEEGFELERVEEMAIWKGNDPISIQKIKSKASDEIKKRKQAREPKKPEEPKKSPPEPQGQQEGDAQGSPKPTPQKPEGQPKGAEDLAKEIEESRKAVMDFIRKAKMTPTKAGTFDPLQGVRR